MSPPRPRWFAPSSIPPILLLTVVTSFAFNHALITTQRKQDVRNHRIRLALLHDTIDYNSRLLYHLNPPSTSWFRSSKQPVEEEWIQQDLHALLRRWKAIGTDAVENGLLPSSSNAPQEQAAKQDRIGPKDITWSQIFLGSKESRSTLTQRWQKVTEGIKQSFTQLNPASPPPSPPHHDDEQELQQLQQLWSDFSKESS